jgi:septal ring factor EnvC (AmiA/AmiB activator)
VDFRLRARDKELAALERKLVSAESQVNELQARLNDAINERRRFEDEINVGICSLMKLALLFIDLAKASFLVGNLCCSQ